MIADDFAAIRARMDAIQAAERVGEAVGKIVRPQSVDELVREIALGIEQSIQAHDWLIIPIEEDRP